MMRGFDPAASQDGSFMPQIGTLNGNPIAAVAGLATLEVLRRDGTYERLNEMGRQLMDALREILSESGMAAQVVGEPTVFDVVFTDQEIVDFRSYATGDKGRLKRFNELLIAHGIFRADTKFYMSLAHTPEDIQHTIKIFELVISQLASD